MSKPETTVTWTEVVKFIGQLNHDLRNHLNGIELQSAFIGEIVEGAEAKAEVKRLREMTAETGVQLGRLSMQLDKIKLSPMPYQAQDFVEDLRAKFASLHPERAAAITWKDDSLGKETLEIDPQFLQQAFLELFDNAFTHGRAEGAISFEARSENETIEFTLREPKENFAFPTENWGVRPLGQMRHGHYALGLFRARVIFEAHHGTLQAKFDPAAATLVTTVSLPRADQ